MVVPRRLAWLLTHNRVARGGGNVRTFLGRTISSTRQRVRGSSNGLKNHPRGTKKSLHGRRLQETVNVRLMGRSGIRRYFGIHGAASAVSSISSLVFTVAARDNAMTFDESPNAQRRTPVQMS